MYVSVLCEPFMLARVTGYRAYVRCSLPTAGAASNLCLASRAAFPVAGVKADANGFLWPLSRQGSAAARRGRRAQQRCSPYFQTCKGALRSDAAGICADFTRCCLPRLLKMPAASLAQE